MHAWEAQSSSKRRTDDAAGHEALVLVVAGQEGRVRAAVAHRHAKALRGADADVGAPLARRRELRQRQQVRCDAHLGFRGVRRVHDVLRAAPHRSLLSLSGPRLLSVGKNSMADSSACWRLVT
jgi:hypothetical protein